MPILNLNTLLLHNRTLNSGNNNQILNNRVNSLTKEEDDDGDVNNDKNNDYDDYNNKANKADSCRDNGEDNGDNSNSNYGDDEDNNAHDRLEQHSVVDDEWMNKSAQYRIQFISQPKYRDMNE